MPLEAGHVKVAGLPLQAWLTGGPAINQHSISAPGHKQCQVVQGDVGLINAGFSEEAPGLLMPIQSKKH